MLSPLIAKFAPLAAKSYAGAAFLPMLRLHMRWNFSGRYLAMILVAILSLPHVVKAAEATWNKIRYQAGTVDAKVNPFDWNTTLRVLPTGIEIVFEGRKRVIIESRNVTALSYGDAAYRRVNDMLVNASSKPVPLFGIVRNSKDHLVGIEFRNEDGTKGAVLLMVHKDSYSELLRSLSSLTGQTAIGTP